MNDINQLLDTLQEGDPVAADRLLVLVYSELRRPAAGVGPDILRYMAQMRLNSDGELDTLKPEDWLALRERMRGVRRASAGQDTSYLRILRRFVPEQAAL